MNNLLKAEFYKLRHNWSFWGITLCSLILGSILLLDSKQLTTGLWNASLYNTPLLYVFVIVFAALFIGGEFENRTLQRLIGAGHKRSTILLSKTISYLAASMAVLAVPLVFHGLIDAVKGAKNGCLPTLLLTDIAVIFIAILAMVMLPLFCALILKDIGKTLVIPMMLYFLTIFVLNSSYTKSTAIFLPMGQLRLLSLNELPIQKATVLGIDVIWIAVLYVGAYIGFCRADLK